MNWDAISAILEAIGVIVIVISLLYLALQIRFARLAAADFELAQWLLCADQRLFGRSSSGSSNDR